MILAGTTAGKIFAVLTSQVDASGVRCLSASHTDGIVKVAFGGESDIFSTVCKDGSVYSWDLSDYERIATAVNHGKKCTSLAMCERSSDVIVGFSNGTVSCYDAMTKGKLQKERCVFSPRLFLPSGVYFSPSLRLPLPLSFRSPLPQLPPPPTPTPTTPHPNTDGALQHTAKQSPASRPGSLKNQGKRFSQPQAKTTRSRSGSSRRTTRRSHTR